MSWKWSSAETARSHPATRVGHGVDRGRERSEIFQRFRSRVLATHREATHVVDDLLRALAKEPNDDGRMVGRPVSAQRAVLLNRVRQIVDADSLGPLYQRVDHARLHSIFGTVSSLAAILRLEVDTAAARDRQSICGTCAIARCALEDDTVDCRGS